jgi:hypothetical protein
LNIFQSASLTISDSSPAEFDDPSLEGASMTSSSYMYRCCSFMQVEFSLLPRRLHFTVP